MFGHSCKRDSLARRKGVTAVKSEDLERILATGRDDGVDYFVFKLKELEETAVNMPPFPVLLSLCILKPLGAVLRIRIPVWYVFY